MRFFIYIFLSFSAVLFYSSCSNKQYQNLFEKKIRLGDSSVHEAVITLDSYKIQSQDVLQIRNLQNINYIVDQPNNTAGTNSGVTAGQGQTYQVEEDGSVALPVIGHVQIIGLTRTQAQKKWKIFIRTPYW